MPTRRALPKEPVPPKLPAELVQVRFPERSLADDGVYMSMEFSGGVPAGNTVEDVEVERCRFDTARLAGTALRRGEFSDVEFLGCDLANVDVVDGLVRNAVLDRCRLTGAKWTGCAFRDVVFTGCRADLSRFRMSRFRNVVFRDCNLSEADFQGAELTGCRFEDCRMQGVQFSQAKMAGGTLFSGCDLWGLAGVESLRGATVKSADAQSLVHTLASALGITIEE